MSTESEILRLRELIADKTREIVDLISERNDLAKQVGAL